MHKTQVLGTNARSNRIGSKFEPKTFLANLDPDMRLDHGALKRQEDGRDIAKLSGFCVSNRNQLMINYILFKNMVNVAGLMFVPVEKSFCLFLFLRHSCSVIMPMI